MGVPPLPKNGSHPEIRSAGFARLRGTIRQRTLQACGNPKQDSATGGVLLNLPILFRDNDGSRGISRLRQHRRRAQCSSSIILDPFKGAHVPQWRHCLASSVRRVQVPLPPPILHAARSKSGEQCLGSTEKQVRLLPPRPPSNSMITSQSQQTGAAPGSGPGSCGVGMVGW